MGYGVMRGIEPLATGCPAAGKTASVPTGYAFLLELAGGWFPKKVGEGVFGEDALWQH